MRGIIPLARALNSDDELRLAPAVSITQDLIRTTWATTRDRNRVIASLFNARILDHAQTAGGDLGWTPFGRSVAVAIRKPRAGDKAIWLFDWLAAMPADVLTTLCDLPQGSVPEWAPLTNELGLTLTRTQTKKFSLRDLDVPTLIEFFEAYPNKAPQPSSLTYAEATRATDIAAKDRMHSELTRVRQQAFGVPADKIDPADFDWDADYSEMILNMEF